MMPNRVTLAFRLALVVPLVAGAQAQAEGTAKPAANVFQENPKQADPAEELQRLRNEGLAKYESGIALDDAMKAFERAYQQSQQAADAFNVAVIYFKKNDAANTKKWLTEALQKDPKFANAHYLLGSLARSDGDNTAAKQSWERARELAPDDGYTYYQLALLAQSEHDDAAFLQALVKALGLEPDNAAALYQMYRYYQTSGNKELAEQTLAKFNALKKQEKFSRREKQKDPGKLAQPILAAGNSKPFSLIDSKPVFAAADAKPGCKAVAADAYAALVNGAAVEAVAVACADGRLLRAELGKSPVFAPLGKLPAGTRDVWVETFDEKGPRLLALTQSGLSLGKGAVGEPGDYSAIQPGAAAPVLLADVDADGDLDIATGGGKILLTNAGKLQFTHEDALYKSLAGQLNNTQATVADVQRDGVADVVMRRRDGGLAVAVGGPDGFHDGPKLPAATGEGGVTVGDFSNDGLLDLALPVADGVRLLWNLELRSKTAPASQDLKLPAAPRFLRMIDYNNDGLLDLITLSADGQASLLRNQGQRSFNVVDLGRWPKPLAGARLLNGDFDRDGLPDLAYVAADGGLVQVRNASEGAGQAIAVYAQGVRAAPSGLLTQLEVRRGGAYAYAQSTGGVQHLGIGAANYVEILRLSWTNGFVENKLKIDAQTTPYVFKESERISGSCPSLFVWNGEKFDYFTDAFISGPMGVPLDRGQYFPVRDREVLVIPAERVKLRDGRLDIRFTEELHESVFLDRVRLSVVDHPVGTEIHPHSRLAPVPPAAEPFYLAGKVVAPAKAQGSDGSDLTAVLANADQQYADFFRRSENPGFAEPHWIELDIPDHVEPASVDALLATGWFFYFESTSMIAQAQKAGPDLPWPWLQQRMDGEWRDVGPVGIPAGKGKTAVLPLHGVLKSRQLRIRSGISAYWDRIAFALAGDGHAPALSEAKLGEASLRFHGFSALAARDPERFDYYAVGYSALWSPMQGKFTAYGPAETLVNSADGRYALFGSGDELALSFRVDQPEPAPGQTRSYLLELVGYVKDGDRYTAHAGRVEPLPYLGLDRYPPPEDEKLRQAQTASPNRDRAPLDFTLTQQSRPTESTENY